MTRDMAQDVTPRLPANAKFFCLFRPGPAAHHVTKSGRCLFEQKASERSQRSWRILSMLLRPAPSTECCGYTKGTFLVAILNAIKDWIPDAQYVFPPLDQ
jgi:hypothetical protein